MTDRLADIRDRLAAATEELPVPWLVGDHPDYGFQEGIWAADGEIVTMRDASHDPRRRVGKGEGGCRPRPRCPSGGCKSDRRLRRRIPGGHPMP